jgi:hypothetical protein
LKEIITLAKGSHDADEPPLNKNREHIERAKYVLVTQENIGTKLL